VKPALALPAAAAGMLVILLAVEWLPSSDPVIPVPTPPAHVRGATTDAESVARDTADWASAITSRPLFSIGRRPPKVTQHNQTVTATGLPRLSGIMIMPGIRRAIFMPETGKPITLGEGGSLDDYTIHRITPDRVYLSGPKGDMVLRPAYDSRIGGTVTPVMGFQSNGFAQPGFPQPGFPQPGFQPPNFNAGFTPGLSPQPNPNTNNNDDSSDNPPPPPQPILPNPPPFAGLRGPFPHGRN
jgi:hypothetical protein